MRRIHTACLIGGAFLFLFPELVHAQSSAFPDLALTIGDSKLNSNGSITSALKIVLMLTALGFAPAMILTMTCFTRIAVVLGMVRTALGVQSMPPNMIVTGLAMFLTFSVMSPVFNQMYVEGVQPYLEGSMDDRQALEKGFAPLKKFMLNHAREKDLALFVEITRSEPPQDEKDISFLVVVPAFVLSELNLAFQIGFLIALPFLVLDMVVSSVLTSMSMITLPPVVISLPLKLMLFVVVDGWHLIIESLVKTYQTG
jgi:flagellar biosynthesis protein FliP